MKVEYEPADINFVIDKDADFSCVYGEYREHDGSITVNLFQMDEKLVKWVINHEILHKVIVEESGEKTTEESDHFIIPKLMS